MSLSVLVQVCQCLGDYGWFLFECTRHECFSEFVRVYVSEYVVVFVPVRQCVCV